MTTVLGRIQRSQGLQDDLFVGRPATCQPNHGRRGLETKTKSPPRRMYFFFQRINRPSSPSFRSLRAPSSNTLFTRYETQIIQKTKTRERGGPFVRLG